MRPERGNFRPCSQYRIGQYTDLQSLASLRRKGLGGFFPFKQFYYSLNGSILHFIDYFFCLNIENQKCVTYEKETSYG